MEKKKALLFALEDSIYVVVGTLLKIVKIQDLSLNHNKEFMDNLFAKAEVLTFNDMIPLTQEAFNASIEQVSGQPPAAPAPVAPVAPIPAARPVAKASPKPLVKTASKPPAPKGIFYKSSAGNIIIIEDIKIGTTSRNGTELPLFLTIKNDRAVNLLTLDREQAKKSLVLRNLIRNKDLIPCTPEEAATMKAQADWNDQHPRQKGEELAKASDGPSIDQITKNAIPMDYGKDTESEEVSVDLPPAERGLTAVERAAMGEDMDNVSMEDILNGM